MGMFPLGIEKAIQVRRQALPTRKDQIAKIEQLETKLAGLEAGRKESSYETGRLWSNVVKSKKQKKQIQFLLASLNRRMSEKVKFENNVIISGVGAGGGDEHGMNKVNESRNLNINPDKTGCERILDAYLRNERDKQNNDLDYSEEGIESRHRYSIKHSGNPKAVFFSKIILSYFKGRNLKKIIMKIQILKKYAKLKFPLIIFPSFKIKTDRSS
ncbi:hypothetical protein BpHYR1_025261 [Brachionus plicatilis]|uniref:Uncharacterized protein n=1 Tax=Brachionus plicatilis TaxID=10195 RepID=A0A3M7PZH0_BRAPC|nr:hypothetical protein BpHYR1_025261 [Brachionus plicatilis]